MKYESGRSLIEIIGVLAITGVMTASALGIYNSIRHNQKNTIAAAELREVVKNTKLLMEMRGDYTGVSVDYLVKAGALASDKAPIGKSWSINVGIDVTSFSIDLRGLSRGECEFFATALPNWAYDMFVNGYRLDSSAACFGGTDNDISFIVR
jgi:hypothetical protein